MATPIRIKRSAVPGKKPTVDQLQLGELAVNFYDGKLFFKQDQGNVGVGTRIIEVGGGNNVGKTIYVTSNGDDGNTGLSDADAKASIKSASTIALPGDTIKVYPGTYVENNPIYLPDNVSVEGAELRRCLVTPRYLNQDLFYVGEGCHVTDISFVGGEASDGAAVVSYRPLAGVSTDRFFDAARLIRENLDFIAQETVGYITSTDYKNPAINIDSTNCADDIKDVYRAICHDITRGGNSKCIGAGKSYFDINGNLDHIVGFGATTIDAFMHSRQIARSIINNATWASSKGSNDSVDVLSAQYDKTVGILTITTDGANDFQKGNAIELEGLEFTCPGGSGITTTIFPDGTFGDTFPVHSVLSLPANSFEVIVGVSTIDHTYVSGGSATLKENYQTTYTQVKDLSIQPDYLTGFNNGVNGCRNVVSAIYTCVGIVTGIIQNGVDGLPATTGFTTTYPGNSGSGTSNKDEITGATYNKLTGIVDLSLSNASDYRSGDRIELRDLLFSCDSGSGIGTTTGLFPSGVYGYEFSVERINADGTLAVQVGMSTLDHTYVSGGFIIDRSLDVSSATYDNASGIATITATGLSAKIGQFIELRDLEFSCDPIYVGVTSTLFPSGNNGYKFKVIESSTDQVVVNVGVSTIVHTYVSGGKIYPPFGSGVGVITKGPYVRNCTNFIPKSIGSKVDGFNADEGDLVNNIGVQGSYNVDSYTQFNQGGIGVSVTNGAYCQLVSIFTICDDTAIYSGQGGQCDLTNSNSSFGVRGLVSQGVGDQTSKCSDRYTAEATTTAPVSTAEVILTGVGDNRPYQGQAIYFDQIYNVVSEIVIDDPGSGYSTPPTITIDAPTGPGIAIQAQATATIDASGSVNGITILAAGSQYIGTPNITVSGGSPSTPASLSARVQPIYYAVDSATLPSSGITTVTLVQTLNNEVSAGTTAYFSRQSFQIVSSHSFQYIGAGNTIETAYPSRGGVTIQENEVIKLDGGDIAYTSTDQAGNFRIGDGVVIDQQTGSISGADYVKSLFTQVTPFILALGGNE
jgi:hypothetical protein